MMANEEIVKGRISGSELSPWGMRDKGQEFGDQRSRKDMKIKARIVSRRDVIQNVLAVLPAVFAGPAPMCRGRAPSAPAAANVSGCEDAVVLQFDRHGRVVMEVRANDRTICHRTRYDC